MVRLSAADRAKLPDRAFAYVDSSGSRKLPIHDESHVRNAFARFDQVRFETPRSRERARNRLLKAAKGYGIVPIGFITAELRREEASPDEPVTAPDRPAGFVTLVFTDIEESTLHLQELGNGYESVLERIRAVIDRAVVQAGGTSIEVRADETFSMFVDAAAAVRSAVAIQNAMPDVAVPGSRPARVRVGIHSGKVTLTSNGYIGLAIHKADRVCFAAHGGQIVVSAETKNKVGRDDPADLAFSPLGRHRLSGLPNTHRLYQVEAAGLGTEFPALRTAK